MSKNIFIAYKHTNENNLELKVEIGVISKALESNKYKTRCMLWRQEEIKENGYDLAEIYRLCEKEIERADQVIFYVKSENKSEGMEWGLEQCQRLNKNKYLLIKRGVEYKKFRNNIKHIFEFDELSDLQEALLDL